MAKFSTWKLIREWPSLLFHKLRSRSYFPKYILLKPASLRLRTYTGEPIRVEGELIIPVRYGSQTKELDLIVVQGDGPSLFGRNWLDHFQLDWRTIGLAMLDGGQAKVDVLLRRYKEVFTPGLGAMKHFEAKLQMRPESTPVFHRPCPVPFVVKGMPLR